MIYIITYIGTRGGVVVKAQTDRSRARF